MAGGTSDILGFEALADWAFAPSATASVVGLNANSTQGAFSFEVTAQNSARLNSAPMSSIGGINPIVLLDIELPTSQANPSSYGDVQMFVNSPALGLSDVSLGDVQLTGLATGTWQTVAFQMPAATAAIISHGVYADLTLSIVLNVASNETGHYLFDNVRSMADVVPSLLGVAQVGSTTKAIFGYVTTSSTPVTIPYGTGNGLTNQSGFITSPLQAPPTTFLSGTHAPFVATLSGALLTWTVGTHSVTATAISQQLAIATNPDGTHEAILPGGGQVNLDSTPPASPSLSTADPSHGAQYFGSLTGKLGVSPSGAATYTVPISMPPGVAGMAPNLNLTYNSQGKDGIAGQGWDLTGTSMIHRCPMTRPEDGFAQPIRVVDDFDITDGLCLDGDRLFEVSRGVYKLAREDFSTITTYATAGSDASDVAFKITTKTGQTRYYGSRSNTHVALPDQAAVSRNSVWLLDRVVDAWGNYYDLHYDYDDSSRFPQEGAYLTSINYTGHLTAVDGDPASTGFPGSNVAPPNIITFSYENRTDPRLARFHYGTLPIAKRLTGITTPQGTYTLTYLPADPMLPSRLQTIGYCNGPTSLSTAPSTACLDSLQFGWDGGNYGWSSEPGYSPPIPFTEFNNDGVEIPSGLQFADLNGDGLVDLIISKAQNVNAPSTIGAVHHVWRNTGKGWAPQDDWNPGENFLDSKGNVASFLVDVDGDGRLDVVSTNLEGNPIILYNRIKEGGLWQPGSPPLSGTTNTTYPQSWGPLHFHVDDPTQTPIDTVVDIDGDGKADIVRQWPNNGEMDVLLNTPSGWLPTSYNLPGGYAGTAANFWTFTDVNGDGLPDLVGSVPPVNGVQVGAFKPQISPGATLINVARVNPLTGSHWSPANPNVTLPTYDATAELVADVDGDGYADVVEPGINGGTPAVVFGTGTDYSAYTIYPSGGISSTGGYVSSLQQYSSTPTVPYTLYGYPSLTDLNGDGLADLIIHQSQTVGQILINQGPGNGWADPSGAQGPATINSTFMPPFVPLPTQNIAGQWIDLNGDGVADIIASDAGNFTPTGAWFNTFRLPVINQFPVTLAIPTVVTYKTITTADAQQPNGVYDDSAPLAPNTTYLTTPLRVVSAVTAPDGLLAYGHQTTLTTNYKYEALRGSAFGRGPQGFQSVTVSEPDGQVTTTTYLQAYPYTGLPSSVVHSYDIGDGGPLQQYSSTTTTYCAYQISADTTGGTTPPCIDPTGPAVPPEVSLFLYPRFITDTTALESGTSADRTAQNASTTVTTNNSYDHHGNPMGTSVITILTTVDAHGQPTSESWSNTTINDYGDEGSDTQSQGKVMTSTVTARQVHPVNLQPRVHKTTFSYEGVSEFFTSDGREHYFLALKSKQSEAGAGYPLELDSTYLHDPFGNVISTQTCDNGAGGCRTTTASYYPTDFVAPQGNGLITTIVGVYQPGLFPVSQTNALGQSEYFVYDPIFGGVRQHTGPNHITTCKYYDSFGNATTEVERCGSADPIVTKSSQFRAEGQASQGSAALVTVVRPQTGAASWTYKDIYGRTVETLERNLNGSLTETDLTYDAVGRLVGKTQPFLPGDPQYTTGYHYDGLSRIKEMDQMLAGIDGSTHNTTAVTSTFYFGTAVTTQETVNGVTELRTETKNAIGKIAWVQDAAGNLTQFQYDSDGNLTDVIDPNNNDVHTHADNRGRKDLMTDPDMGSWKYCYNGFGDLIGQIDAKNSTSTCSVGSLTVAMTYDALGRMTSKTDVSTGDTAKWLFDSAPGAGIGKLAAMVSKPNGQLSGNCPIPTAFGTLPGGDRAVKSYTYDQYGDIQEVDECADGTPFTTTYQYDSLGRQSLVRYPAVMGSQLAIGYHYTNLGFLQYLTDESTDYSVLWQVKAVNGLGQIGDEQMRNGVETIADHNPVTGWTMNASSTAHYNGNMLIQSWSNTYDENGNVLRRTRSDSVNDYPSTETFGYDTLNRLTSSEVLLPTLTPAAYDHSDKYTYDALGNFTGKNGSINSYGTGCVGSAGPHAICSLGGGTPYGYDPNGNMTSGGGRSVTYDVSNKPTEIVDDSRSQAGTVEFAYGADSNRVLQVVTNSQGSSRTVYVGLGSTGKSLYERTQLGTTFQHTFFIYAGSAHNGSAFAVRVLDNGGNQVKNSYFNFDHLGSTTAISDDLGKVTSVASAGPAAGVLGYDPWGGRRNPDGQAADPAMTFTLAPGDREFTGQETIPTVGLVNMNGRVYDPLVGRFLSPDPNVQSPNDLQSYNRYSYVLNNPLRDTDPTGYWSWKAFEAALPGVFVALAGAGACAVTSGLGCLAAGFVTSLVSATVAKAEGATWLQAATGAAIGMFSGTLGGSAGSFVGGAFGVQAGSLGEFAAAEVGGAVGGAIGGVLSTYLSGGHLGENVLLGAAQGAVWAAIGWGANQSPIAKADASPPEGLTRTRLKDAGPFWDWATNSKSLFSPDGSALSPDFIKRVQPIFDSLQLNVDLSQVRFIFDASGTNRTIGYDIHLSASTMSFDFDDVLGNVLHELAHVVQTVNAPGLGLTAKIGYIEHRDFEERWMFDHMYGNADARYEQDEFMRNGTTLRSLSKVNLLPDTYSLDSVADRFRDLLLTYHGK